MRGGRAYVLSHSGAWQDRTCDSYHFEGITLQGLASNTNVEATLFTYIHPRCVSHATRHHTVTSAPATVIHRRIHTFTYLQPRGVCPRRIRRKPHAHDAVVGPARAPTTVIHPLNPTCRRLPPHLPLTDVWCSTATNRTAVIHASHLKPTHLVRFPCDQLGL